MSPYEFAALEYSIDVVQMPASFDGDKGVAEKIMADCIFVPLRWFDLQVHKFPLRAATGGVIQTGCCRYFLRFSIRVCLRSESLLHAEHGFPINGRTALFLGQTAEEA